MVYRGKEAHRCPVKGFGAGPREAQWLLEKNAEQTWKRPAELHYNFDY
jgi:hypothetical protein